MWADILTLKEAKYCERAIGELEGVQWARPLLDRIQRAGGIKNETKPLLFELRFAYELNRLGSSAEYEYKTGVGNSTVDFRVVAGTAEWLIELVSLQISEGVRQATHVEGLVSVTELRSDSTNPKQSEEAEMIRAQEKIVDKVFLRDAGPIKFPEVQQGRYHVIVCDMRGFLINGGDR